MVRDMLQNVVKVYGEIILLIPMPWRVGFTLFIVGILICWLWQLLPWIVEKLGYLLLLLVEFIASFLLLPEYLMTNQLRQHGHTPLPGVYIFGDVLQGIVGFLYGGISKMKEGRKKFKRPSIGWVFLIAFVPIVLWYARPHLEDTLAVKYVDQGIAWWYALEEWALTRR